MAARIDVLMGQQRHQPRILVAGVDAPAMSRHERVARLQRRRLAGRASAALESALWLAGTVFVTAVAVAGITGLH